jgi:hypothetical protein
MNAAAAGVYTIINHFAWSAEENCLYLQDCNLGLPVTMPFFYPKI